MTDIRRVGTQVAAQQLVIYVLAIITSHDHEPGGKAILEVFEILFGKVIYKIVHEVVLYLHIRSKGDQFTEALRTQAPIDARHRHRNGDEVQGFVGVLKDCGQGVKCILMGVI